MGRHGRASQADPAAPSEVAEQGPMGGVGYRRYPLLLAQSVQQTVGEFLEAIESTCELRKQQKERGEEPSARFPWRAKETQS